MKPKVEPSNANDLEWLENVDSAISKLNNTSLNGVQEFSNFVSGREADLVGLLDGLTEGIDKPIFKALAHDLIGVFGSFYIDEAALCCLIKNILVQLGLQSKLEKYQEFIQGISDQKLGGIYINEDNFELVVDETDFGKAINVTIAIIDIVITFLTLDLNDLIFPVLDFIRDLTEAVAGFVCIALQEIIFTLRDSAIDWILSQIDEITTSDSWAECLPYMDFVSVLKKYINDYGLTKKLMTLIEGFISNTYFKLKKALELELGKNVKTLEFLKLIRSILVNIKDAVMSWEFCAFLGSDPDMNNDDGEDVANPYFNYLKDALNNPAPAPEYGRNDFIFADDNTILNNNNDGSGVGSAKEFETNSQNSQKLPSNSELRAFLQNYMNVSSDVADSLLSDDGLNTGGDGNGTKNKCGMVLNPNNISDIVDRIINQSRVG